MKKIAFIINPVSGKGSKAHIPGIIEKVLDRSMFEYEICYTERRNHATELAAELSGKGYRAIVAVGGDGTVNEIAKALLFSRSALGIIPFGSGNGLARHLNIPMDHRKAVELLNHDHDILMDSGTLNGIPFFCTSGVGFDAYIGKEFANSKVRGFATYVKTTLRGFIAYKPGFYRISAPFGDIETHAFLITVGNTSQYGNNVYICPYADVQDGMLDVTIIKPFPGLHSIDVVRRLFSKTLEGSKYVTLFKANSLRIFRPEEGPVHVDGEPMEMGKEIDLAVVPASLRAMVLPAEKLR